MSATTADPALSIKRCGDGALLIELGPAGPVITARARTLAARIREADWPGVVDVIHAYRTVLLRHDPLWEIEAQIERRVAALVQEHDHAAAERGRLIELPVHYGGADGPDLEDVARHTGLSPGEVIRRHAGAVYQVEFLGFSPGFPYLSGLPPELVTPRLSSPRTRVPAGSVGIAGLQTGFYPQESPGGWRLIGRVKGFRFDVARPETLPYAPGDRIRFVPVDGADTSPSLADHDPPEPPAARPDPAGAWGADGSQARAERWDTPTGEPARSLRVVRAGPLSTVQDLGRPGLASLGYSTAGALDPESLRIANRLVGNAAGVAALEVTLDGGTYQAGADLLIAIAGADLSPTIDDEPVPCYRALTLRHGAQLRFGARRAGMRAYVAVAGGIETIPILGSRATDALARLGGLEGRPLRAGDLLPIGEHEGDRGWTLDAASTRQGDDTAPIRVIWGPQDHWFDAAARAQLLGEPFVVSPRSDRTGIRLEGTAIAPIHRADLASEGAVPGAIQVPPGGAPIVLLADSRGVGGYPKIACVITADLPRLAQLAPGARFRFAAVTPQQAVTAARARREWLASLPLRPAPDVGLRCLLETRSPRPLSWRCPRSLACAVSARCLVSPPVPEQILPGS